MKRILAISMFILAMLAWATAQQPSTTPVPGAGQPASPSSQTPSAGQPASPSSQAPSAGQSQPSTGTPDQTGSSSPATKETVTEGCLGSTDSTPTLTDKAHITYKLNLPPNFDASSLSSHGGESVQIIGDVTDPGNTGNPTINVQAVRTGTGTCPAGGAQSPPQQ